MPKAKIFNLCTCVCAGLLWSSQVAAQSPPVIGQIIEQAKKSKLNELAPPPPVLAQPLPALAINKSAVTAMPATEVTPALWSLSGVNQTLMAEVLFDKSIHRVKVARGVVLPGGWTVLAGDAQSLTLRHDRQVVTLFPADLGSTGAEFPSLRNTSKLVSGTFGALQEVLNSKGIAVEYANAEPAQNETASNVTQARQAAASLPKKP